MDILVGSNDNSRRSVIDGDLGRHGGLVFGIIGRYAERFDCIVFGDGVGQYAIH